MKFKIIYFASFGLFLTAMNSGIKGTLSSGAPVGSTGAPGEETCAQAGCHVGDQGNNNLNTGAGILSIQAGQSIQQYVPGAIYDFSIELDEPNVERFGFSFTALDQHNNKAGTLIITDAPRTQIFQGARQFTGREYMTYRMLGTDAIAPGRGRWTFRWQAPDQHVGPITFYVAGVSANNDGTDSGDQVYTETLTIQ
jgi:hypothetical protein